MGDDARRGLGEEVDGIGVAEDLAELGDWYVCGACEGDV